MRLTRRQLTHLVEKYLREQEEEMPEEEVEEEEMGEEEMAEEEPSEEAPVEDEPVEDTPAEDEPVEDEPVEEPEPEPEPGADLPDKTKPFEIIIDDEKHTIQFFKDKSANVLKLKIDGIEVKNPKPQDFVTLAGLGLQGKRSDEDKEALTTIVKKVDGSLSKFDNVAKVIKDKMNADRKGFSVADIRQTISKVKR